MTKILYKIISLFIGIILFLLILELGLRVIGYFPDWITIGPNELDTNSIPRDLIMLSNNTEIKFEHRPGASYITTSGLKLNYTINQNGFRDKTYNKKKPDNTIRIISLGDSLTYGIGVKEEETFSKILEKKLNENSEINYEVLNFGVGGYNTVQEIEQFKLYGLEYKPDIVIINYFLNDPYNVTGISIIKKTIGGKEECTLNMLLYIKIPCGFKNVLTKSRALLFTNDLIKKVRNYGNEDKLLVVNNDPYLMNIVYTKLKELKLMNSKIMFVVHPVLQDFNDKKYLDVYDNLIRNATSLNFGTLNLVNYYKTNYTGEELRIIKQDVSHPNKIGHELTGNTIYEELIKQQFVNP